MCQNYVVYEVFDQTQYIGWCDYMVESIYQSYWIWLFISLLRVKVPESQLVSKRLYLAMLLSLLVLQLFNTAIIQAQSNKQCRPTRGLFALCTVKKGIN